MARLTSSDSSSSTKPASAGAAGAGAAEAGAGRAATGATTVSVSAGEMVGGAAWSATLRRTLPGADKTSVRSAEGAGRGRGERRAGLSVVAGRERVVRCAGLSLVVTRYRSLLGTNKHVRE